MGVSGALANLARLVVALRSDTRGIILPYVSIMLVVIVGVSVLALDAARHMSLQTQLQNGADALALAGAAELDRMPDSELRAANAINTLLSNSSLFGTDAARTVQPASIQFYSRLPATDDRPLSAGVIAADATQARFVAVTVRPITLSTILPATFFGGASRVTTGASAVAGFDQVVCDLVPMFVCNPYETAGMAYDQASAALQAAAADPAARRRLMRLRQYRRGGDRYESGDYGFLISSNMGRSSLELINALASVRPSACFSQNGVSLRPGSEPTVREAFNVRFDIYDGAMAGAKNDSNYRPSVNVRKGYVGGGAGSAGNMCNAAPGNFWPIGSPPNQATGLPLDRTWPSPNATMGNGDWDFATYWQVNHGAAGRDTPVINGIRASNSNPPSRYATYRYEIEQGYVADRSPGGESGAPACYAGAGLADVPDRRVLETAIINCQSLGLSGGSQVDVPVAAFGKLFVTLPLTRSQTDLYVELVGLVKPGDPGDFEMVQLYR
jgi:Putative Flp pilus-assembly TadE/G-like